MDDGDWFAQIVRVMLAVFAWGSKNPREAGVISIVSVSTDIWAIAALQAMGKADATVAKAAGDAYDRFLSFLIRFLVLFGALLVFAVA